MASAATEGQIAGGIAGHIHVIFNIDCNSSRQKADLLKSLEENDVPQQDNYNMSYMPENQANMMSMDNRAKSLVEDTKKHRALYPEIHYKLEPFISSTCEAIETSGIMPSQEEMDEIADNIFDDFCQMYPDMANYMKANDNDMPEAIPTQFVLGGGYRPGTFGRFRRRGIGRDLISALLLSRLFGRRPYYPYYQYYPYY